MFVILHDNYKIEENMEVFLRLLLVLVMLFPMSEVTALTDRNSDFWKEKSDAVDIEHQTLSKMHKLEKTICQLDSEEEKEPADSGCSFPSIQTDEGEMQDLETFKKENQDRTLQDANNNKVPTKINVQDTNIHTREFKPVFFVKTNLLYDLLTFVNGSVEIPITKNISAEATVVYPWWRNTKKHRTIQLRYFAVTPKYYFKNANNPYSSFFTGLIIGGGKYDLQWTRRGVQGSMWHLSPMIGYSHHLSKRWKMEYSASVGFVHTKYQKYTQIADTPFGEIKVKDYPWVSKVLNTVLPTSLSVSLVYTFTKSRQQHGN